MEEAVIPGANQRNFGVSAEQKLYHYLCSPPAGADAGELVGLLLSGAGSYPELGARLVRQLIGADPNFIFDADTAQWRLAQSDRLRVGLDQAEFTVVDLEPPADAPAPARSSRSAPTEWLVSGSPTPSRSSCARMAASSRASSRG